MQEGLLGNSTGSANPQAGMESPSRDKKEDEG